MASQIRPRDGSVSPGIREIGRGCKMVAPRHATGSEACMPICVFVHAGHFS